MLFRNWRISSVFLIGALQLSACSYHSLPANNDDNIIGVSVDSISNLNSPNEAEAQDIVLFDQTVRRLHEFDLSKMKFVRSFPVNNPDLNHYVLYNNVNDYVVDLSLKGLTVFNRFGQATHDPIHFEGQPRSAAFHRGQGILVVYDSLMSVGLLKIDSTGNVINSWVGGANVTSNLTIAAGDISDQGKLILALSDGSFIVMDTEQSMQQKHWVVSSPRFTTTLTDIRWLAPVPGNSDLVIARNVSNIYLLNLNTQSVVATYPLPVGFSIVGSFKSQIPHIIINYDSQLKVVYANGNQLTDKTFYLNNYSYSFSINQSILDINKDQWSFVESNGNLDWYSSTRVTKNFKRYRVSDLLAQQSKEIAAGVQVQLADNYIFNLYPSELGYATRQELTSPGAITEIKLFNVPYVKK